MEQIENKEPKQKYDLSKISEYKEFPDYIYQDLKVKNPQKIKVSTY